MELQENFKWITRISRAFQWDFGDLGILQGISRAFQGVSRFFFL